MTSRVEADRENMRSRLRVAAEYFSVPLTGEVIFGWRDRTIGSRVIGTNGERWLRVSWSQT